MSDLLTKESSLEPLAKDIARWFGLLLGPLRGGNWRVVPFSDRSDARLHFNLEEPGKQFHLSFHRWDYGNKLTVRGDYPVDLTYLKSYNDPTPEITVSVHKGGEQIAKDVYRRFLTTYIPMVEKGLSLKRQWEAREKAERDKMIRLAGILGVDINENNGIHIYEEDGLWIECTPTENSAEIEIKNAPLGLVEKVLGIIAEARALTVQQIEHQPIPSERNIDALSESSVQI